MNKYEDLDSLLRQFSARELASYIYMNDINYALDLMEYIQQEEVNDVIEHSGQTYIKFEGEQL